MACNGGVEVASWTVDREIRIWFSAFPHHMWALWWQGSKRCLQTSRCPCRGRIGRLKTPSCPKHCMPGSRSKFGNWTTVPSLYSWNIAECDVKPQPTNNVTSCLDFHFFQYIKKIKVHVIKLFFCSHSSWVFLCKANLKNMFVSPNATRSSKGWVAR